MQYHFHLIRNILKLPYCFPSEAHQPPDQITRLMAAKAPLSWGRRLLRRKGIQRDLPLGSATIPC